MNAWLRVRQGVGGGKLAPVGSNHHSQIQSLVSCHWTRGQSEKLGFSGQNIDAQAHRGGQEAVNKCCVGAGSRSAYGPSTTPCVCPCFVSTS